MAKVVLSDGKEVEISTVLFNKEQNINVSKTYVTTVKKSVTRVGEKFYHIEPKKEEKTFEPLVEVVPEMPEVEKPGLEETVQETTVESEPTNEEIMNSFVAPSVEEEKTVDTAVPEESKEEVKMDSVNELAAEPQVEAVLPVAEEIKLEPEVVETPVKESNVEPAENVLSQPLKEEPVVPIIPTVSAIPLSAVEPTVESGVVSNVEPVKIPEVEPVTLPVEPNPEPIQEEPELIFDASKESNLNIALGEVTSDTSVKVDDASSFREFGQDSTSIESFAQESQAVEAPVLAEPSQVKTLTRSKGFANSKFVTVIAILFFVAACVFLGYEVFNYFQLTK